jgi:hypothetical protein
VWLAEDCSSLFCSVSPINDKYMYRKLFYCLLFMYLLIMNSHFFAFSMFFCHVFGPLSVLTALIFFPLHQYLCLLFNNWLTKERRMDWIPLFFWSCWWQAAYLILAGPSSLNHGGSSGGGYRLQQARALCRAAGLTLFIRLIGHMWHSIFLEIYSIWLGLAHLYLVH